MTHNGKYYTAKLKAQEENSKDIRTMFKAAKKPRYTIKYASLYGLLYKINI